MVRLTSITPLLPRPEQRSLSMGNHLLVEREPHISLKAGISALPCDTIVVTESGHGQPTQSELPTHSRGYPPQSSCHATPQPISPLLQFVTSPKHCYRPHHPRPCPPSLTANVINCSNSETSSSSTLRDPTPYQPQHHFQG
jgi:hypothetical protein